MNKNTFQEAEVSHCFAFMGWKPLRYVYASRSLTKKLNVIEGNLQKYKAKSRIIIQIFVNSPIKKAVAPREQRVRDSVRGWYLVRSWCCNLCAKRGAFWLSFDYPWFWSSFCQIVYFAADADVVLILSLLSRHSHTNLVEPLVTAAIALDPVYLRGRESMNYSWRQRDTITQLYKQERCSRLENKTSIISIMLKLTSFPSGCWHRFAEHTDQSSSESEYDRSERELEGEVVRFSFLLLSWFILGFFFLGFFIWSLCCPSMFSFSRRRLLFFSSLSGSFLLSGTPS